MSNPIVSNQVPPFSRATDIVGDSRKRVMLVGPAGSGKTMSICSLPGKKFIYAFDSTVRETIIGEDNIDFVEFLPSHDEADLSVQTLKKGVRDAPRGRIEPKQYVAWEDDWHKRISSNFFADYDWVCFDSMTNFSDLIMSRVMHKNGRYGKQPEQADYGAEMTVMRNIISDLTTLECNILVTAHVELSKDEYTGRIYGQIMFTGKNRIRVPTKFTDIFATLVEEDEKTGARFLIRTVPDRLNPVVRVSKTLKIEGLNDVEDVTIDLKKPIQGQGLGQFFK
jgi:GTPase SAR1 family protein